MTITKNKKKFIIIAIVALLIIGGIVSFFIIRKSKQKPEMTFNYVRTVTLSYGNLQDTIVASGTIESQTTSSINSSINNAIVSKINYEVGDYVKEGDVIIELDTTNLDKQITKQQTKVEEQQETLQEKYNEASDSYSDVESSYSSAKYTASKAYTNFEYAKSLIKEIQNDFDKAESDLNIIVSKCYSELGRACVLEDYDGYTTAKTNYDVAETALKEAKDNVNYDELEKEYNSAKSTYDQTKTKYEQAESSFSDAEKSLNKGADTESLEDLYDSESDYQLKAKSSGQITSIGAVLGSNTNGTLATIQDTSKLKISLTIDEYDILKLTLGMKASIKTDASDKSYDGEVSQISPTAVSSIGSSGGFEIEVKITSEDVTGLLIGMNAEVTIIVSESDKNFSVPIDAILDKEDGTSVIYARNSKGEFEEVQVTKGNKNGYYVEILGNDLYEGMVVRASADESKASVTQDTNDIEENMENAFGDGFNMGNGFPRGDMPSGGFPGGGGPGGR